MERKNTAAHLLEILATGFMRNQNNMDELVNFMMSLSTLDRPFTFLHILVMCSVCRYSHYVVLSRRAVPLHRDEALARITLTKQEIINSLARILDPLNNTPIRRVFLIELTHILEMSQTVLDGAI